MTKQSTGTIPAEDDQLGTLAASGAGSASAATHEIDDYTIAQLAWGKGMAVGSIVRALGMDGGPGNPANIMKVKRALQRAVRDGILMLSPPPIENLERRLREALTKSHVSLDALHVEQDHAAACFRAARLVEAEISGFLSEGDPRPQLVIANAGGGTVGKICEYLQRLVVLPPATLSRKRLIFVSLNAAEARHRFDECANFLAVRLAKIYDCEHLAVVSDDDDPCEGEERSAYRIAIENIDLLITSAGSLPRNQGIKTGFLVDWLRARGLSCPDNAIGDIAFHFIDEKGYLVKPDENSERRIKQHIKPEPEWNQLDNLFHTGKVLLVLTGEKATLGHALIAGAHARRCVVDAHVANGMLNRLRATPESHLG